MDAVMHIWLARDPETGRILAQQHDWRDGDFPRELRGHGWPRREHDVDPAVFARMLRGELDGDEVDALHQAWWKAGR